MNAQQISAGIVKAGVLQSMQSVPVLDDDPILLLETTTNLILHSYQAASSFGFSVNGVGVAVMGQVDYRTSRLMPQHTPFPSLVDFPLSETLATAVNLPVSIDNEANCHAIAEALYGGGQNSHEVFFVMADDIIDGAMVRNGQLWRGVRGCSGDVGYLVADWLGEKPITLHQRASSSGIVGQYAMRSRKFAKPMIDEILTHANHDDQLAMRVLRDGGRIFGTILSPFVGTLDPEKLIVAGKLTHNNLWWSAFETAFRQNGMPNIAVMPIEHSELEHAVIIGAAALADYPEQVA